MLAALVDFSIRRRRWVLASWLAAAVLGLVLMPAVSEFSMSTGFLAHGVETVDARHLAGEKFPQERGAASTALLVVANERGLRPADEAYARRLVREVPRADPEMIVSAASPFASSEQRARLVSRDGTAILVPVGLRAEAFAAETGDTVEAIRESLPEPPPGTEVYVTGDAGLGGDHIQACLDALAVTALVTLLLIAVILLAVYRAPLAAAVPLVAIGASAAVSLGLIGVLMRAGVEFSSFLQQFLILIVFGAGTDYCLFLVSRYREELAEGHEREAAVARALGRIGPVIASSAAVVAAGFLSLGLARFEMFRTIGPGLALAIAVTLAAGLTLVPALLASVSPSTLFWPFPPRAARQGRRGLWPRLAGAVVRRPVAVLAVGLVVVLGPLAYLPSLEQGFEIDRDLPPSYESVRGYELVAARFDQSESLPVTVLVSRPEGWRSRAGLAELAALDERLGRTEGVGFVRSAVRPLGRPVPLESVLASPSALAPYLSGDGTTARLFVGTTAGVYSNEAYDTVRAVRTETRPWAAAARATAVVGGASAESVDLIDAINADLPRVFLLVAAATFLVIFALLRSVLLPLLVLASLLATVAATLAVTALVFQEVVDFRVSGVDVIVPLLAFVLLVVLAADYSIFLLSRIREESERHGLEEGLERAVGRVAAVVAAAGLILAGTFAALLLTPLASLVQMGFATAFGILLAALVVQPLVLPALLRLLGPRAWWPTRLVAGRAASRADATQTTHEERREHR